MYASEYNGDAMIGSEHMRRISRVSPSRIVFVVMDGVGGLPHPETGKTELESARTPNLDRIAGDSLCGLTDPIGPGITPGSAPGHLALFGYDPVLYDVGRGIVEALGIDLDLEPGDVAARGNFCTIDDNGIITDRRAGRLSTARNAELCRSLSDIAVNAASVSVFPVKEHRFVLVLRGEGLSPEVTDSDPQQTGLSPKRVQPLLPRAQHTADVANQFLSEARVRLTKEDAANMVLLRGFSLRPEIPSIPDIYKLKPVAIAAYPMYRGLARLVGMDVLPTGESPTDQVETLRQHYDRYDFFFVHYKHTDSRGEDGNFQAKVEAIEEFDNALAGILSLDPDVMVVAGDHSTPATLAMHSWHPVPFMIRSRWCRPDGVSEFSEQACLAGGMGRFPATEIMPLAMANALKLDKFGA